MPMIMITGQKGIMSSRQARFQIVDIVSRVQAADQAVAPDRRLGITIPTIVRDAFRVAMEERPGPVLLELPEDVAGEETEDLQSMPGAPDRDPGRPSARRWTARPT